ncbi:MAG: ABC transporter permease [Micromonosporaceae bacterium]|nr:ABC transporter permease [Micromonosporaceae bacterium]
MSAIHDAYIWLNDPLNWTNPGGILDQLRTHLRLSALAVGAACLVAWPVGIGLGHRGRGGGLVVVVSNISLAVPTLALLTILPLTFLGFGDAAVVLAIAVFAVPPLLANAYTGVREVDPEVRDAARGMGLSGWQVLTRVELPLAVPYLAAGFRTAAVQSVATVTLAALIGAGGLGAFVTEGFGRQDMGEVLAGGLLTALLCLLVEAVLAAAQRLATPRALRTRRRWALRPHVRSLSLMDVPETGQAAD